MSATNKLSRRNFLGNLRGKKTAIISTIDELINQDWYKYVKGKNAKNVVNSLQLLMYSKKCTLLFEDSI
jgi:hypothetical protein